jgi:tRNA(Ile)-lysidine synthase
VPAADRHNAQFSRNELDRIFASIEGPAHVALAVSGGSDSVAMMRLAADWRGAGQISVLTVDHGLREGSDAEAAQTGAWARDIGLEHHVLAWTGEKPATGIQAKAREARYRLLETWCVEHGADLLTAHTIEDQAETVLMRMARSTSLDGLAGIAPERAIGSAGFQPAVPKACGLEVRAPSILRPLLGIRRERLRAYLQAIGQPWIDDPSNEDERFERVRVRKAMAALGIPAEALAHVADEARAASSALWNAAGDWAGKHCAHHGEGYGAIPAIGFAALGADMRARVLGLLIARYGAGTVPEPHERSLLSEWIREGTGLRRTLGGAVIAKRRAEILVGREPGRIDPGPVAIPPAGKILWDRRFEIEAPPGSLILSHACAPTPRRSEIPAFVQASLPIAQKDGRRLEAVEWSLSFVMRSTINSPSNFGRTT